MMNENALNMQLPSPRMFLNPVGFVKGVLGLPEAMPLGP